MSLEAHERNLKLYQQDLALVQELRDPTTPMGKRRQEQARLEEALESGCVSVSEVMSYYAAKDWPLPPRTTVYRALGGQI